MHGRTRTLTWLIGLACTASAAAQQWGVPQLYNRANNPSQNLGRVGRVGGYSTGGSEALDPFGSRAGGVGGISGDLFNSAGIGPSSRSLSFQRNRFTPTADVWTRPEFRASLRTPPIRSFSVSQTELNAMSGFSQMVNPYRRLETPMAPSPRPITSMLLPREYPSTYHQFFNLVPASDADPSVDSTPPADAQEMPTINEIIGKRMESDLEIRRSAAIAAFRDLMREGAGERSGALDALESQLDDLRRAAPGDFVPRLLLAHIAFERRQTATALSNLAEAVRCFPDMFVRKVDIGAFFGSRAMYERQLRRYVQAGAAQNADPAAIAVEAYCALMLGDTHRATMAAERAATEQRARSFLVPPTRNDVEVIVQAILAASAGS